MGHGTREEEQRESTVDSGYWRPYIKNQHRETGKEIRDMGQQQGKRGNKDTGNRGTSNRVTSKEETKMEKG